MIHSVCNIYTYIDLNIRLNNITCFLQENGMSFFGGVTIYVISKLYIKYFTT